MKPDDEPTDLLSEARRGPLSREEEARLEELVEHSPEARILHYAGWTFDRDSSARAGDDVLVARLAARAAEGAAKPAAPLPVRRRKRPFVTLLAAALALASTAGAGVGVVYFVRAPERVAELTPAANPNSTPEAKSKARARAASPTSLIAPTSAPETAPAPVVAPVGPAPIVAPISAPESAPTPVVAPISGPTPLTAPASHPAPAPQPQSASIAPRDALSASALFGQANRLRLAGDTRGAIVVYKLLTEHHPGSAEADLAELSLGKLLLASGDTSQALTHFRRAAASGGALGSEALWGEAGALKALGRTSEERSTLERLLAQYPDGAYAKAARKRLGTDVP